ncbi:amidohydrolase family protein [Sphingobium sp. V4]|uniref:N-acyl-D-amino-acid deacylase family protein n=1 Tax=Sphingobium sp. V4 TaxID=3038927 RepID=UPI002557D543|nr:amidohydrolase family protein [Sphingobium sp. V4]WIW89422.1 amidohydrolase family protein [Sphingobium sp. V4]
MYDTIIRGGHIIDGTGRPAFTGDIAIENGRIAKVGGTINTAARQVIDADGAIVTPGFIDPHTHFDGQFLWDDVLEPAFSHGVTTAIGGNCGVGFAPLRHDCLEPLIELMEGVEDIPGIVLTEGLDWQWSTFPDYLDRLKEREYTIDVAAQVPHAPLRVYVMGERALSHEDATAEDIAQMARLMDDAMAAGAAGFSAGRILEHVSSKGVRAPGYKAREEELIALAQAMSRHNCGVFQIIPKGDSGDLINAPLSRDEREFEHGLMERIAMAGGRPVNYLLHQIRNDPDDWVWMCEASARKREEGIPIYPQVAPRGIGFLSSLDGHHPFLLKPSYREIAGLAIPERAAAMRDPERRARILAETDIEATGPNALRISGVVSRLTTGAGLMYALGDPPQYEPSSADSFQSRAEASGVTPLELYYDLLASGDGGNLAVFFMLNYWDRDLEAVRGMMDAPGSILGLGDGGAHLLAICDGSFPTFCLSYWTRDRTRGDRFPLERMVHKLTGEIAALYGFSDRGRIAPGLRADINVIDHARLQIERPRIVNDLPSGGRRYVQGSRGYLATLVNGVVTRRFDSATGARPGRFARPN